MAWRTFDDEPGELPGDAALLRYLDEHLDVRRFIGKPRRGLLAWTGGEVLPDDDTLFAVLAFAWDAGDDVAELVPGQSRALVMSRLADLAVRRVLVTTPTSGVHHS